MTVSIIGSANIIAIATGGVLLSKHVGVGSSVLEASPAYILSQYLIEEAAIMTIPSDDGSWPLYVNHMPDGREVADDCGVLYDTAGAKDGRLMTGVVIEHLGIQLRLRSLENQAGYAKAETIVSDLDAILNTELTIGSDDYIIHNVSRTSPIIPLGIEGGTKRRFLFTVNFLVTMKKV